jgi:hypothetical protein
MISRKVDEFKPLAVGPPALRVPPAKLHLNLRDVTRVESLKYGILEEGILEGLDRLMAGAYTRPLFRST